MRTSVNSKLLLDAFGKCLLIFLVLMWSSNVEIISFIFMVLEHLQGSKFIVLVILNVLIVVQNRPFF